MFQIVRFFLFLFNAPGTVRDALTLKKRKNNNRKIHHSAVISVVFSRQAFRRAFVNETAMFYRRAVAKLRVVINACSFQLTQSDKIHTHNTVR